MSKRIVMSILASAAVSVGGFFVSCGEDTSKEPAALIVQLPEGCTLVSPRDALSALSPGTPVASVKPGKNQFVVSCGGRMIELDRDIKPDQRSVTFSEDDVR